MQSIKQLLHLLRISSALGVFSFFYLICHYTNLSDSLFLSIFLIIDFVSGGLIWIRVTQKEKYSATEILGCGFAISTSLNTFLALLFNDTVLAKSVALFLPVIALFIYRRNHQINREIDIALLPERYLLLIPSLALTMVGVDRPQYFAGALTFILFSYLNFAHKRRNIAKYTLKKFLSSFEVSTVFSIVAIKFVENAISKKQNLVDYLTGFDDAYFEAASKSVTKYGPFDNIFASNTKFAYYWFSDAWSGFLSARAGASDWVVTTQFGFIIIALAISLISVTIFKIFISDNRLVFVASYLLATTTLTTNVNPLLTVSSLSDNVAMVWFFLFILTIIDYCKQASKWHPHVIIFSITVITLTKISIAMPILAGLFGYLIIQIFLDMKNKFTYIFVWSVIFSFLCYLIFIRPNDVHKMKISNFDLEFSPLVFGIYSGFAIFDIFFLFISKTFASFSIRKVFFRMNRQMILIFSSISFASFLVALFMKFEVLDPSQYLISPFIVLSAILSITIVVIFVQLITTQSPKYMRGVLFTILLGVLLGIVQSLGIQYLDFRNVATTVRIIITLLIPLIFAVALLRVSKSLGTTREWNVKVSQVSLVSLLLVAATSGSFFAQSIRSEQRQLIYANRNWDVYSEEISEEIARVSDASNYMKSKLTKFDVIASNSTTERGLLAALTGIRNYASSYYPNLWGGLQDRYNLQSEFAKYPSESKYESLRDDCVTWFYLVKNSSNEPLTKYLPFAEIRFNDSYGAVLKLRDSRPLSSFCD